MHIAFIGFGEAARAFVASLRECPDLSFAAYDILVGTADETALSDAARSLNVKLADNPAETVRGADWVISAVTAASGLDAARSVAGALAPGVIFLDINSVSAARKVETATEISASGAIYVDMAVMAPVHPLGHRTPVLVAGDVGADLVEKLTALRFDFDRAGPQIGAATSVKMVRSLFVKGMEAVTVQALMAAHAAGCLDTVYASLSGSFAKFGWPKFADYRIERVTRHGVRRSAEMRESAATMRDLGFEPGFRLADAIADVQEEIGRLGIGLDHRADLSAALEAIAELRDKSSRS